MASMGSQKATSTLPSSSTDRQKYEVFLSFCGGFDQYNFAGLLYASLKRIGISVFKSDGNLGRGGKNYPRLKDAIEESQYAVVVISDYFSATNSSLFELDVIMERWEMGCLTVFPVFYEVNPFNVRSRTPNSGTFFVGIKEDPNARTKKWENWKAILTKIGNCFVDSSEVAQDPLKSFEDALEEGKKLYGWHVKDRSNMQISSEIVNKISLKIFGELIPTSIDSAKFLVGLESQAMKIMELLCSEESSDVLFIGICGMTGIGKTTLAKVIYERARTVFKAWSFISDIGESGNNSLFGLQRKLLLDLQVKVADSLEDHTLIKMLERLLTNKKVLLILDDVRQSEQVEALAGDAKWFGKGSRIILTSRNHHLPPYLCKDNGNFHIYEVKELNENAALQLFCFKAFNKLYPEKEFKRLTRDILDFTRGLPLALENLGSKFSRLEKSRWESYLIQLKANLDGDVAQKLRVNFDKLGDLATKAFLDIICFFEGESKNYVTYILECLDYPSESILEYLKHKSLLKFEENKVLPSHNFLTQMGQEIAKCAGLWCTRDIVTILREKESHELNAIRGVLLKFPPRKSGRLCYDGFSSMKKLQLLEINIPEGLIWNDLWKGFIKLKWSGNPLELSLSNELCVLRWDEYPFQSLPHGFKPENLVELKLRRSSIKALRGDVERFHKLKCLDLHCSKELIETPDFSDIRNLERLYLSDCSKLSKVHHSIGFLERLRELSLRNCFRLRRLPNTFRLPSLESLDLCGCSRRKKFPGGVRNLKSLRTLNLNSTPIKRLPRSFTRLPSLKDLYISGRYLPEEITIGDYSGSPKLPNTRYRPSGLLTDARSINICDWSSGLSSLEKLDLSYRNLGCEALPSDFGFLSSLTFLNLSGNKLKEISDSVHRLSNLRHLLLNNCVNIERLPRLPSGLRDLDIGNCPLLERFYNDFIALPSYKRSRPCDWVATNFAYSSEPYCFLNLHPGSTVWSNQRGHSVRWAAWGLSCESEIPEWFYHRRMGRIPFPADQDYDPLSVEGYALFIICEVPNRKADLSFDCWLQEDDDGLGVHLRFLAHERLSVRHLGVWMYIPSWGKDLVRLGNESSACASLPLRNPFNKEKGKEKENMFLASIEVTSRTVEVKKFGARVVCKGDASRSFSSPSFGRFFRKRDKVPCIEVHGPVKFPIDPSSKSSGDAQA